MRGPSTKHSEDSGFQFFRTCSCLVGAKYFLFEAMDPLGNAFDGWSSLAYLAEGEIRFLLFTPTLGHIKSGAPEIPCSVVQGATSRTSGVENWRLSQKSMDLMTVPPIRYS